MQPDGIDKILKELDVQSRILQKRLANAIRREERIGKKVLRLWDDHHSPAVERLSQRIDQIARTRAALVKSQQLPQGFHDPGLDPDGELELEGIEAPEKKLSPEKAALLERLKSVIISERPTKPGPPPELTEDEVEEAYSEQLAHRKGEEKKRKERRVKRGPR